MSIPFYRCSHRPPAVLVKPTTIDPDRRYCMDCRTFLLHSDGRR